MSTVSPNMHSAAQHQPSMPAILNREPSQQDLELARHLQSFQSQGVPHQEPPESQNGQPQSQQDAQQVFPDGESRQLDEHRHQSPNQQQNPAGPSIIQFTPLQQQQQQSSPAPSTIGQMCSNCGTTKTPLWRRSPTGAVICNACGLYYKARNQMRPAGVKRGAAAAARHQESPRPDQQSTPTNPMQGGATYVPADRTVNGTCPGGGRCNGTGGHDGCNGCPAYNNRISKTAQVALRQASNGGGEPGQASHGGTAQSQQSVTIACQNCGTTITPLWRRDEAGNTICNACGLYYKLHNQHRPVGMKKAEIKRRKRIVPSGQAGDDQSSVYTSDVAEEERLSLPPGTENSTPPHPYPIQNTSDSEMPLRSLGGPIPVDFTDMFRSRKPPADTDSHSSVPRKRSFSATASDPPGPYAHAQNLVSRQENIDPSLSQSENTIPQSGVSPQHNPDGRRAALQAEAEKMRRLLVEKEREIAALADGP